VLFEELQLSGREYNDPSSRFFHSYLRGKEAIAAIFPDTAAYSGGITMFSGTLTDPTSNAATIVNSAGSAVIFDAGIATLRGGTIQTLTPGGPVILGAGVAVAPGANTGIITYAGGDIQMLSSGSVLLGQSRIFTEFGGSIQIWSEHGDINAGIGAKTTVVYQPPDITYDSFGAIEQSPTAPTSGAGIATLDIIAGSTVGDVDLVAPEGVIDAGEAGIRVSGNLTLAARAVLNAANIEVGGKSTGIPVVAAPNLGAVEAAAAAAGAATAIASNAAQQQQSQRAQAANSTITVEIIGYGE
jgi:hypothetical protein